MSGPRCAGVLRCHAKAATAELHNTIGNTVAEARFCSIPAMRRMGEAITPAQRHDQKRRPTLALTSSDTDDCAHGSSHCSRSDAVKQRGPSLGLAAPDRLKDTLWHRAVKAGHAQRVRDHRQRMRDEAARVDTGRDRAQESHRTTTAQSDPGPHEAHCYTVEKTCVSGILGVRVCVSGSALDRGMSQDAAHKRERAEGEPDSASPPQKLHRQTTLRDAANAAPEHKKAKFLALVTFLGCGENRLEQLLAQGPLFQGWNERVRGTERENVLGLFFMYCMREAQPVAQPEAMVPMSLKPSGAAADLSSATAVWSWMKRTLGVTQPNSGKHILEAESLSYPLKGREEAVACVTEALVNLWQRQLSGFATTDRTKRPIPVCSGLSGMGKTRMAEEVCAAFADKAEEATGVWAQLKGAITGPKIGVIVTYGNGKGES
jgi:hypothetical protein